MRIIYRCAMVFFLVFWVGGLVAQSIEMKFSIDSLELDTVFVGNHFGNQKYLVDTLIADEGEFTFRSDDIKQGVYFLYHPKFYFEFIVDGRSFWLKTSKTSLYKGMLVEGSKENEIFRDFQVVLGALQKEQSLLLEGLNEADAEDSVLINAELRQLTLEANSKRQGFINNNRDSFVANFLTLMNEPEIPAMEDVLDNSERNMLRFNYYKTNFLPERIVSDTRLLRTPLIHNKVMRYFDQALVQQPDSISNALDLFFSQISHDDESFRYWLVTLFKKYAESKQMGMDAVMIHLIEAYYLTGKANWITKAYEQKLREEVAYVKPNLIGQTAPELEAVDLDMQPFNWSLLEAEYVLLFIYDPECGHCKKVIGELEDHDQVLDELGVKVLALCTTTYMEGWRKFVSESNPQWGHLIDPSGKSYFRVSYNVRSTPQMYLLDGQKKILAKKLNVDQFVNLVKMQSDLTK